MKRIITCLAICSAIATQSLMAQDTRIPASSSSQRMEQDFGLGTISLNYSRPNTKGRKIFNGMEPYGTVWRTGANSATIIKFTDTVQVEGHQLLPGEYSLFTIPGAAEWTIIFNKTVKQWGAYAYDAKQDVMRFNVKSYKLDKPVETLTFQFADVDVEHCQLQLSWENTGLSLHLQTDVNKRVLANIERAMKGEKKPYYLAAIWFYNHNVQLDRALEWIKLADKASPNAYNMKYWLARIQLKNGDKQAAITSANEGLKLAQAEPNLEYIRLNKEVLHDAGAI